MSLQAVIDAARRLDELSTARLIGEAAEAVHKAQKNGQPLNTLSPQAIIVTSTGVKLEPPSMTTTRYAAPEKLRGQAGDRRSDVFSLGVLLWEALAHTRLFEGATDDAVKNAVFEQEIRPPSELNANVPAELDAICKKALARDPGERFHSTKVMAAEIATVLDDAGYPEGNEQIAKYLEEAFPRGATLAAKLAAAPAGPASKADLRSTVLGIAPIKDSSDAKPAAKPEPAKPEPKAEAKPAAKPEPAKPEPAKPAEPERAKTPSGALSPLAFAISTPASAPAAAATPAVPSILTSPPAPSKDAAKPVNPAQTAIMGSMSGAPVTPAPPVVPDAAPAGKNPTPHRGMPAAKPGISSAETVPTPALVPTAAKPSALDAPATGAGIAGLPAMPPGATVAAVDAPAASASPAAAPAAPKPAAPKPAAQVVDDDFKSEVGPNSVPVAASAAAAPAPATSTAQAATPAVDPTDAVSLPRPRRGTDGGRDVLAGWGWSTDSHAAIDDGHAYEEDTQRATRKRLLIAIGGATGAIALIVILAIALGGSKDSDKKDADKPKTTAAETGVSPTAPDPAASPTEPTASTEPAATGSADTGTAAAEPTAAGSAGSAVAAAGSATEPAPAGAAATEPTPTEPAKPEPVAATEPAKPEPAKPEPAVAKPEPAVAKPEPVKVEPKKPEPKKVAVAEPKKPEPKKPDPKVAKTAPKVAKTAAKPIDPYAADKPGKADPATAYKTGFQQYVRGDTAGALATFKGSLQSAPGYPPTWRGLGLVYEKLGQKAQAKRAFSRYLQLSPNASDAAQIRGRMERLGS